MRFFVSCQIDVVNKQFFSSLSWNNPLPKTTLGESYILMIGRHLDVKKKHSLDLKFVFISFAFSSTWLPHGQLWASVEGQQFRKVDSCQF